MRQRLHLIVLAAVIAFVLGIGNGLAGQGGGGHGGSAGGGHSGGSHGGGSGHASPGMGGDRGGMDDQMGPGMGGGQYVVPTPEHGDAPAPGHRVEPPMGDEMPRHMEHGKEQPGTLHQQREMEQQHEMERQREMEQSQEHMQ